MGADVSNPNAIDGPPVADRYTAIETNDGDVVVFDAEIDEAWIQASSATCLTQHR